MSNTTKNKDNKNGVKTETSKRQNTKSNTKAKTPTKKTASKKETSKTKEPAKKTAPKKESTKTKESAKKTAPKKESAKTKEPAKKTTPKKESTMTKEIKKEVQKNDEKVAEPIKEDIKKKDVVTKSEPIKAEKTLEEAPNVKSASFTYSTRTIAGICVFLVAFSFLYSVAIKTTNQMNPVTTTESITTTAPTTAPATTKPTTETTTESTTIVTTQAPEVTYTRKAVASQKVVKNKLVKLNVPYVSQLPKYPTGCEAASATMVLRYWGYGVSIDTVVNTMPSGLIYKKKGKAYGPSIYEKFVGDPRCTYTSTTPGYGAFAPVVTGTINSLLDTSKHVAKNVTGSSLKTLFDYIDDGCPVIVWSTYKMQQPVTANVWYIEGSYEKEPFQYPRGTHVTVLYGYDNNNIYLLDPYTGGTGVYSQTLFSSRYNLLGCQAVVVVKQDPPTTEKTTKPKTTKRTTTKSKKTKDNSSSKSNNTSTSKATSSRVKETSSVVPSTKEETSSIVETSTVDETSTVAETSTAAETSTEDVSQPE